MGKFDSRKHVLNPRRVIAILHTYTYTYTLLKHTLNRVHPQSFLRRYHIRMPYYGEKAIAFPCLKIKNVERYKSGE